MGNKCCVSPQKSETNEPGFTKIVLPDDRPPQVTIVIPSPNQDNQQEPTSPLIPELDAEQTIQQLLKTHPPGTKIIKALYDFEGDTREKAEQAE